MLLSRAFGLLVASPGSGTRLLPQLNLREMQCRLFALTFASLGNVKWLQDVRGAGCQGCVCTIAAEYQMGPLLGQRFGLRSHRSLVCVGNPQNLKCTIYVKEAVQVCPDHPELVPSTRAMCNHQASRNQQKTQKTLGDTSQDLRKKAPGCNPENPGDEKITKLVVALLP